MCQHENFSAAGYSGREREFLLDEGRESEYDVGGFLSADKKGYPLIISASGAASPPDLRKPPYHKRGKA